MKRAILLLSLTAALACGACSTSQTATVNTTLATAEADARKALTTYGVIKGIALVAETADPSLAPQINATLAVTDPLAATLTAALADASPDTTAIESTVSTLTSQATALEDLAAPAVKVIAGSAS